MSSVWSAESVCGHPDKLCDLITEQILEDIVWDDKTARVAVEIMATERRIIVTGEITTNHRPRIRDSVRDAPLRAVWIMNDATDKTVRKLKDGNGQYLWQPALTAGTPDMILDRPIHTSVFVPEIKASAKTVAFEDLGYYWIADRQGRSFKRLNELFATIGQVGFLASQRLDGKLILPEAVKVLT